jgi:hypothetical protein
MEKGAYFQLYSYRGLIASVLAIAAIVLSAALSQGCNGGARSKATSQDSVWFNNHRMAPNIHSVDMGIYTIIEIIMPKGTGLFEYHLKNDLDGHLMIAFAPVSEYTRQMYFPGVKVSIKWFFFYSSEAGERRSIALVDREPAGF